MIIFHGDNYPASRRAWLEEKSRFSDSVMVSGADLAVGDIPKIFHTASLFGRQPAVFVENFFSRRPSSEKTRLVEFFSVFKPPPEVFFYDAKDISAQLKSFPPGIIRKFDWPKYLYQFLDTLSLPALRLTLEQTPPEVVMASLAKQLHNLLLVKYGSSDFPAWQSGKLKPLANRFSLPRLITMQNQLLAIDSKSKNSLLSTDLESALVDWCLKNVLLS